MTCSSSSYFEPVPLKSKRVVTSRLAWSTPLRASCASKSLTTSKEGICRFPVDAEAANGTPGNVPAPDPGPPHSIMLRRRQRGHMRKLDRLPSNGGGCEHATTARLSPCSSSSIPAPAIVRHTARAESGGICGKCATLRRSASCCRPSCRRHARCWRKRARMRFCRQRASRCRKTRPGSRCTSTFPPISPMTTAMCGSARCERALLRLRGSWRRAARLTWLAVARDAARQLVQPAPRRYGARLGRPGAASRRGSRVVARRSRELEELADFISTTLCTQVTTYSPRQKGHCPALDVAGAKVLASGDEMKLRWQRAVASTALRHRNLLTMSVWDVFPHGEPADLRYVDLLPVLRHANCLSFRRDVDYRIGVSSEFRRFHERVVQYCAAVSTQADCETGINCYKFNSRLPGQSTEGTYCNR